MTTTTPVPFTLTHESVMVIVEGKPYTAQRGSPQYTGLRDAILREDWDAISSHLTQVSSLKRWLVDNEEVAGGTGLFTIEGQGEGAAVLYNGDPIPTRAFVQRMWEMAARGESPAPLLRFYERLQRNPSSRSVEQLWSFLMHTNIPIEEDGHFLAYKGVNEDLTDCHTGKIVNTPGTVHQMQRNKISDDPNHACHFGFHVGALGYVGTFGTTQLICRVDPEHVVCVPFDCNSQKMRVCKYEVVGFAGGRPMSSTVSDTSDLPRPDSYGDEDADGESEPDDDRSPDSNDEPDRDDAYPTPSGMYDEHRNEIAPPGAYPTRVVGNLTPKKPKPLRKAALDKKDGKALLQTSIEDLRRYAGALDIVGASKIPGGKSALVTKILRARRRS